MSSEVDPAILRRYALEVMVEIPGDYADALAILDYVRELIEWREGGKTLPNRVVRLVGPARPPA